VGILETVRALTQPEVLRRSPTRRPACSATPTTTEPIGHLGMVRATRDVDVQKGMAVMMDVMRHVGRAARS
jgi:uncharacterized protein YjgD (DUF1641 family)